MRNFSPRAIDRLRGDALPREHCRRNTARQSFVHDVQTQKLFECVPEFSDSLSGRSQIFRVLRASIAESSHDAARTNPPLEALASCALSAAALGYAVVEPVSSPLCARDDHRSRLLIFRLAWYSAPHTDVAAALLNGRNRPLPGRPIPLESPQAETAWFRGAAQHLTDLTGT